MNPFSFHQFYSSLKHEHRFMMALVLSQLFFIALIQVWPVMKADTEKVQNDFGGEEIFIQNVINTRQQSAPASPPKPIPPVPVPNDQIIEDLIVFPDIDDLFMDHPFLSNEEGAGVEGEGEAIVGSPDNPPSIVRIVEPTLPDAAKEADIKARILVTFLVNKTGRVDEAYVSEIRLYNGNQYKVVENIGYGILEAVLKAALKWEFRPARNDGEAVKTYVENSFTIGF